MDAPASADAALAVGRYYLALLDYAYSTHDDDALRAFSDPACEFCNSVTTDIAHQRESDEHSVGGDITITGGSGREVNPQKYYTANFAVEQTPSRVLDANGGEVSSGGGGTFTFDVGLYYRGGTWQVAAVDVTPQDSQ